MSGRVSRAYEAAREGASGGAGRWREGFLGAGKPAIDGRLTSAGRFAPSAPGTTE